MGTKTNTLALWVNFLAFRGEEAENGGDSISIEDEIDNFLVMNNERESHSKVQLLSSREIAMEAANRVVGDSPKLGSQPTRRGA